MMARTPEFHVLHEAADRLDHYLDTYEPSTAARIAGHQLSDELRKIAETDTGVGRGREAVSGGTIEGPSRDNNGDSVPAFLSAGYHVVGGVPIGGVCDALECLPANLDASDEGMEFIVKGARYRWTGTCFELLPAAVSGEAEKP